MTSPNISPLNKNMMLLNEALHFLKVQLIMKVLVAKNK